MKGWFGIKDVLGFGPPLALSAILPAGGAQQLVQP